jgi:hypothetical protein
MTPIITVLIADDHPQALQGDSGSRLRPPIRLPVADRD